MTDHSTLATHRTAIPSIDLHQLPKPAVVEPLNYETILHRLTQDFLQRVATLSELDLSESDPAMKLLEVAAWRELLLRQRINEAARSHLLAFATGSDLDHLATFYAVKRLHARPLQPTDKSHTAIAAREAKQVESDTALRARLQAKIASGSTAGSRDYYRYQALSSDVRVKAVHCDSPGLGIVRLSIWAHDDKGLPDDDVVTRVRNHVTDDSVRVLTDTVQVVACEPTFTPIVAKVTLQSGVMADAVLQQARRQCHQQWQRTQGLGQSLTRAWLIAHLFMEGMAQLEVITPAKDVVVHPNGIVIITQITLQCQGENT